MELSLYFMELDAFLEVYDDYATLVLLKPDEDDDEYFDITLSLEDAEKITEMFCSKEI